MSHYTLAASGLIIDAFQWHGGALDLNALPTWMRNMSVALPGDDTICLQTYAGTMPAAPTDWVARGPGGSIFILPDALFSTLFTATA